MDLKYLEYVVEIADQHSISRAAENLFMTQSNLSQYLIKLENELGIKLFDRKKSEVSLTLAGALYVEAARKMLQEKNELYNKLSDIAHSKTGSFSVGVTQQWGSVALSHIIRAFKDEYPDIYVNIMEETANPLMHALLDEKIDMAIFPVADVTSVQLEYRYLLPEELVVAVPREHFGNLDCETMPTLTAKDLEKESFILSRSDTTIRKLENIFFGNAHMQPRIFCEINNHEASLNMVEQGLGSSFVPVSCTRKADGIIYAHTEPAVQWHVVVAFRKGFRPRECENHFIDAMMEHFKSSSKLVFRE
ncbi:MAG: LysR family transcriptional regulator [Spirochaetales bacterium]|nr:LysR family transcriptional regulator [Spirochaetales bacterium]